MGPTTTSELPPEPDDWPEKRFYLARLQSIETGAISVALTMFESRPEGTLDLQEISQRVAWAITSAEVSPADRRSASIFIVRYGGLDDSLSTFIKTQLESDGGGFDYLSRLSKSLSARYRTDPEHVTPLLICGLTLASEAAVYRFAMDTGALLDSLPLQDQQLLISNIRADEPAVRRMQDLLGAIHDYEALGSSESIGVSCVTGLLEGNVGEGESFGPGTFGEELVRLDSVFGAMDRGADARLTDIEIQESARYIRELGVPLVEYLSMGAKNCKVVGVAVEFGNPSSYSKLNEVVAELVRSEVFSHVGFLIPASAEHDLNRDRNAARIDVFHTVDPELEGGLEAAQSFVNAIPGDAPFIGLVPSYRPGAGSDLQLDLTMHRLRSVMGRPEVKRLLIVGDIFDMSMTPLRFTEDDRTTCLGALLREGWRDFNYRTFYFTDRENLGNRSNRIRGLDEVFERGLVTREFGIDLEGAPFGGIRPFLGFRETLAQCFDGLLCQVQSDSEPERAGRIQPKTSSGKPVEVG